MVVGLAEVPREQWCLHRIALRKDAGRRVVHVILPRSWEEQVVVHTVWCTSPIRGRVGSVSARGVGTALMWAVTRPNHASGSFYVAMARAHARSCDTSRVHEHVVQPRSTEPVKTVKNTEGRNDSPVEFFLSIGRG